MLNTNDLAEVVTYCPGGGKSRSVTVIVDSVRESLIDDQGNEENEDSIHVTVLRDRSHAKGGIDKPAIGDEVTRATAKDPDGRPYQFSGEIIYEYPSYWTLVFWRHQRTSLGIG